MTVLHGDILALVSKGQFPDPGALFGDATGTTSTERAACVVSQGLLKEVPAYTGISEFSMGGWHVPMMYGIYTIKRGV